MNITTRQLTAFVAAARHRSFTRAAEQIHISQAGLSLMMRELEGQLGCRLFDRTTRSVVLTSAGERLLPVAQRAVEDLSSVVSQLDQLGARLRKTLRVGSTPLLAATLLPSVYQALQRLRPEITLRFTDAGLEDLHRQVANGELDCGLGMFSKAVPGIERSLLFSFDLIHVRATRHTSKPSRQNRTLQRMRWRDLGEAPLVQLPPDNPIQELVTRQLKKNGLTAPESPLTFNHIETMIAMAAAGAGAAIVPSFALASCRHHAVEVAQLVDPALKLGLYLITKRGRGLPEVLSDFTKVLLQVLQKRPE